MDAPADRALVLRARRGEVEAFGELVRRHQTSVFNVCYRLLGERREAEDLAQEAFLRAYQRLHTFDVERPFGPWIRRVAANVCFNYLQQRTPAHLPLDDEFGLPTDADRREVEAARERGEVLRAALRSLPPHYRAAVELRHFHDLTYAEIADALKISLSDVKRHLYRARKLLAQKLRSDV
jgi:RNA polymerase sigma-70 factor (ECF subfamily)